MSYLSSSKPITDIKIIANKTELPGGYQLLEHAADGQKVQLWEGRNLISLTKRFLCYSRQNFDIGKSSNEKLFLLRGLLTNIHHRVGGQWEFGLRYNR